MAITSFGKGFLPTPAACVKMSLWRFRSTSRFKHAHVVPTCVSNVTKPAAIGHTYCCAMQGAYSAVSVSCHMILAWRCVCVCVCACLCLKLLKYIFKSEQGSDSTCVHMSYVHLLLIHIYCTYEYWGLCHIGMYWTILDIRRIMIPASDTTQPTKHGQRVQRLQRISQRM